MRRLLIAASIVALALALRAAAPEPEVDRIVIYKQQRKLFLMSRGKEIKSYRVALGADPVGPKQKEGDNRTPEGSYLIDYQNPKSRFYKSFHISYPNAQDRAAAQKLGVKPGGDIMIHGLPRDYAWVGKAHTLHDWTAGCIAVTNEEIDELWRLVKIGTPVDINP
jgi:murein L,D-transpeptidase YafK